MLANGKCQSMTGRNSPRNMGFMGDPSSGVVLDARESRELGGGVGRLDRGRYVKYAASSLSSWPARRNASCLSQSRRIVV
jgi:hypothetical protein